ncbi:MAG TPA: SWIM zinc finger family protein [Candidatus Dormibacteraeota bacterium]
MRWTVEQVAALAPDAAAGRAGQAQADVRRWTGLGRTEAAAWGECRGSAAQPYRTCADLGDPAFRCTCPSRKLPCKHALGLLFLVAAQPAAVASGDPPDWVQEWLARRAERAERAARPAGPPADPAAAAEDQARRARRREGRVAAGVDELRLWLGDLVRGGMAELPTRPRQFWAQPAARMVDAQAPGLARLVGELGGIPHSGPGWPDRLLTRIGRLHLALEGYRRIDSLPEPLRAELRTVVGFTETRESVVTAGEHVTGRWLVLGRSVREDERLRVQRTWLQEAGGGRPALVLDFAALQQPLDPSLVPGTSLRAELAFYPASLPLRALVVDRDDEPAPLDGIPGAPDSGAALRGFAAALAANPWLDRAPMAIRGVVPVREDGVVALADAGGARLPLAPGPAGLVLQAVSGGHPIDVFGEWDGAALTALSAWADGEFSAVEAAG